MQPPGPCLADQAKFHIDRAQWAVAAAPRDPHLDPRRRPRDRAEPITDMPAVSASRCSPNLHLVYARPSSAGDTPKVSLTAVMRKVVGLASAQIAHDHSKSAESCTADSRAKALEGNELRTTNDWTTRMLLGNTCSLSVGVSDVYNDFRNNYE